MNKGGRPLGFRFAEWFFTFAYILSGNLQAECKSSSEIPVSSIHHRDVLKVSSFAILGNCGGGSVDNST